jgi:uncharacterized membrane protein
MLLQAENIVDILVFIVWLLTPSMWHLHLPSSKYLLRDVLQSQSPRRRCVRKGMSISSCTNSDCSIAHVNAVVSECFMVGGHSSKIPLSPDYCS